MGDWERRSGLGYYDNYEPEEVVQNIKMVLKTAPTLTIVTTAEAKNYLKLSSDTSDDNLVSDMIKGVTGIIERECGGLAICQQTWTQKQQGGISAIDLQREPVLGVPTVSYYSEFSTVTATNITLTTHFRAVENELFHKDGYWDLGRNGDGYTIDYDVGVFTASNYTSSGDPRLGILKTAILRTCAWLYEQREEGVTGIKEGNWSVTYDNVNLPSGIKRLIMPIHTGKGLI